MAEAFDTRIIVPMKGKLDSLPRGEQWVYELKWDGMRVLAFITRGNASAGHRVRLQSSNGRDVTPSFPELQALAGLADLFDGVVLDGEIVAFTDGKPSFGAMQNRMHVTDASEVARRAATTPVLFVAFDLLHLDGHDMFGLPLENRRALLEQISDDDPCWTICEQHRDNVDDLLQVVADSGLEGIVAKRSDSLYHPGRRSHDWIKIKPRLRQEFVVGGWLDASGSRAGHVGSLLVGYYDNDGLRYAGRAGSGLTEATVTEWRSVLVETAECPFAETPGFPRDKVAHWCSPDQVVEIAFGEWTRDGTLRHPVVLGRRTDKAPRDVRRE